MVKFFPIWWKQCSYALFLMVYSNCLVAQVNAENGASSVGLSSADLFLTNPWSVNTNPAMLGKLESRCLGVSYYSPFMMKELSSRNVVLSAPFRSSGLGISIAQYGYEYYKETKWSASYGRNFSEKFSMGIQSSYMQTNIIEPYGRHGSLSFNMALFSKLSDQVELAALIINPSSSKKDSEGEEPYPQKLKLGLNYIPIDQLSLILQVQKEHFHPLQFAAALSYRTQKKVKLNMGFSDEQNSFSFGMGIPLKSFGFYISSTYSYQLGFTPAISLSFESNRKKQKNEQN